MSVVNPAGLSVVNPVGLSFVQISNPVGLSVEEIQPCGFVCCRYLTLWVCLLKKSNPVGLYVVDF